MRWARYRTKRGSLHPGMRMEYAGALLATLYCNAKSKRGGFKLFDFMPHAEEPPVTLEQAMEQWR